MSPRLKSDTSKLGAEAAQEEKERAPALSRPVPTPKATRARKRNPDQREMLLPITGGAKSAKVEPEKTGTSQQLLEAKPDRQVQPPRPIGTSGGQVVRSTADLIAMYAASRPHRHLTLVETLEYLAREWEAYGTIDATNMRHVYWALGAEKERASASEAASTIPRATARAEVKRSRIVASEPPDWIEPLLCKRVDKAPSGPEWVHEVKFDGYRIAARIDHGSVQLLTSPGEDWSDRYPSIVKALEQLPVETAYIDGALCEAPTEGVKGFEPMQPASGAPAYYAFDLMELDGAPVHRMLLLQRKRWLADVLKNSPAGVFYVDYDAGDVERMRREARRQGLWGIVSKRSDAAYEPGDNGLWVKSFA